MMRRLIFSLLLAWLPVCENIAQASPTLPWKLLRTIPREQDHFTQGLVYVDNRLFESTGRYGQSALTAYDAETFQAQKRHAMPADIFGEGLTFLHGKLYQASWTSQKIFVYNTRLELLQTLPVRGEGWGLTTDGTSLVMSNGSDTLQFLDPATGELQRTLRVADKDAHWAAINELEWVQGHILANIWHSNTVLLIDGTDGHVEGLYDLTSLSLAATKQMTERSSEDVLNGLAWNPGTNTLLVTGKDWPAWFELEITLH